VATATVFVASAGEARIGAIRNAIKRLQFARGSVIGTVVTKFDAKRDGYGYDGYGYDGYAYRSGDGRQQAGNRIECDQTRLPERESATRS
jgi:polysaccharide biosynthesis transport protein